MKLYRMKKIGAQVYRVFINAKNYVLYTKGMQKLKHCVSHGHRRSIGDTHHYHVGSILGYFGTPKQKTRVPWDAKLEISTETPGT